MLQDTICVIVANEKAKLLWVQMEEVRREVEDYKEYNQKNK